MAGESGRWVPVSIPLCSASCGYRLLVFGCWYGKAFLSRIRLSVFSSCPFDRLRVSGKKSTNLLTRPLMLSLSKQANALTDTPDGRGPRERGIGC